MTFEKGKEFSSNYQLKTHFIEKISLIIEIKVDRSSDNNTVGSLLVKIMQYSGMIL